MRYGQIRKYDVANGVGIRTSIFVTGCTHNCKDCFNRKYMDFNFGEVWTDETTNLVTEYLKDKNVAGLTLLGGEPMQNAKELLEIVRKIKSVIKKDIWIYSGYTFEEILEDEDRFELLKECDVLVDGRFVLELKDLKLKFRGSSNQRIIDIKKTLETGEITLYME
ncbi:MAG: anaerobic ribonucleoside-triphosphate reductase activating protein [Peptoniphilaceae bacterium]|uniref:anaerobic ribonucleoside-triphosphate reductase activating protein n=1 Tax=Parvimonas sp. TaxID=1944660 RepID=UPI0025CDC8BF|nr:anaerobic ribonucleoside-triphosphate reductase activating protein [Parvimonas sp.]MCI5997282.1 anaerobic ribonucleoside-triphosphate reductase activating protein [Parvimonas sp.]MDD7765444.1 anaerobic ribonucleoside-triphosphate reductase activating protein [Peptoniphilaceae bacterium]MDY3050985.1 anaerobic ribonucleoside-triphosphate reductase activating protein [Parvimonas sp.]